MWESAHVRDARYTAKWIAPATPIRIPAARHGVRHHEELDSASRYNGTMSGQLEPSHLFDMRKDWDQRARENARHYIATGQQQWDDREFFRSGEINVANEVMPEMLRICGGSRSPLDLCMLEIGCGVGRMTRMLSRIFGQVIAVDVSGEMIDSARVNLKDLENVTLVHGDGASLPEIKDNSVDFAFSFIVFQHIPSVEVIHSYCLEAFRVLRRGSLFKVQINGSPRTVKEWTPDTWNGVTFSPEQATEIARLSGFLLEATDGAGSQYFWLWLRKPWE